MDSLRGPTFLLLLQNLRSGMSANGSSNDSTICNIQTPYLSLEQKIENRTETDSC